MAPDAADCRAGDNAGHEGNEDGAERRAATRVFLMSQVGTMRWRRRLSTLRGHVENAERCRTAGVDGVARLRGLGRRDGHVGWLTQRGRGIGLCLVGLGLSPGPFKSQGLGGIGGGVRLDGIVAGLVLVARHVTRRGLVPLLVRSLALAIPPFKVIDIHTGRPLGLANKHLLVLYPQTARGLARNAK